MRQLLWLAIACALCTLSHGLQAQPRDPAAAELLFSAGRQAFEKGDYATACSKFDESQRLDPAAGTLINLAACQERLGQLASAWQSWREALSLLHRDDERRPEVQKQAEALEARLPRLVIRLAPGAPGNTRVIREGVVLGTAAFGLALPVNPGRHTLRISAPGRSERRVALEVSEGQTKIVLAMPGDPYTARSAAARKLEPAPAQRSPHEASKPSTARTLGFVTAGVGIVGFATAAVTGLFALQKKAEMDDDCAEVNATPECGSAGMEAAAAGKTWASISTLSFAIGAIGTGVGGYLILSSKGEASSIAVRPLPNGAALALARRF